MDKRKREIDITPSTSIYTIFKNFNYKPVDAIAEFIDNSTQSYKDQKNLLVNHVPIIFIVWSYFIKKTFLN